MDNLYIIYMPRVAAKLREMGYKLIKVSPNRMKPQYDVYWFEDTPQFRKDIPIAVEESRKK